MSVKDGHLELARADVHAPLEYWNAIDFKWLLPPTAPTGPASSSSKSPENTVTGLYFGLGSDVTLLGRKGAGRGGRGGVAGAP